MTCFHVLSSYRIFFKSQKYCSFFLFYALVWLILMFLSNPKSQENNYNFHCIFLKKKTLIHHKSSRFFLTILELAISFSGIFLYLKIQSIMGWLKISDRKKRVLRLKAVLTRNLITPTQFLFKAPNNPHEKVVSVESAKFLIYIIYMNFF